MLKVDLHAHTGDDPIDSVPYSTEALIDRAAELGYGALAITLHDGHLDVRRHAAYATERGVTLIPGIERTICGAHVLLLNFTARGTEGVRSFEDLARLRQREPGLVVAPHPFFPLGHSLGARLEANAALFDAVEWHGLYTRTVNFNLRARAWAEQRGLPMVGNCDTHRLYQFGSCYSLIEAERDPASICQAIREHKVQVVARPVSTLRVARTVCDLFSSDYRARWRLSAVGRALSGSPSRT